MYQSVMMMMLVMMMMMLMATAMAMAMAFSCRWPSLAAHGLAFLSRRTKTFSNSRVCSHLRRCYQSFYFR